MNLFVTVPTATLSDPGTSWTISNPDQVESSRLLLLACEFHWNYLDISPCSRQLARWVGDFSSQYSWRCDRDRSAYRTTCRALDKVSGFANFI